MSAAPTLTESFAETNDLSELKAKLQNHLVTQDDMRPPEGLPTGVSSFDDSVLWRGLPKGEITLISSEPGLGGSTLWLQAAEKLHKNGQWAAWVNSDWQLYPSADLRSRLRLDRLLVVKNPKDAAKLFWILQEMISSTLFDLIGCHLPRFAFKTHQLMKLKNLARLHKVALVFVTVGRPRLHTLFALVLECGERGLLVLRALHRPTPFRLEGVSHANSLPAISGTTRHLLG